MQHNNWNAFIQVFTARNEYFRGKRLMLMSGEAPTLDFALTEADIASLVSARLGDWIGTYETDLSYKVVSTSFEKPISFSDESAGDYMGWGNSASTYPMKSMNFKNEADHVSIYLKATSLVGQNAELTQERVTTPTWCIVADPSGAVEGCALNETAIYLTGTVSALPNFTAGSLLFVLEPPVIGKAPAADTLGSLLLPIC